MADAAPRPPRAPRQRRAPPAEGAPAAATVRRGGRAPAAAAAAVNTEVEVAEPVVRGASLGDSPGLQEIKVSAKSTTKTVAGALAYLARERRSVRIVAGSAACINTALKASATARRYVEADGVDLYILPSIVTAEGRRSVSLSVVSTTPLPEQAEVVTYTCGSATDASKLSGALANRLRENKSAEVKCVGASAVLRAATAAALAAAQYAEASVGIFASFINEPSTDGEGTVSVLVLKLVRV